MMMSMAPVNSTECPQARGVAQVAKNEIDATIDEKAATLNERIANAPLLRASEPGRIA